MSEVHRERFEQLKEMATSAPILKNFTKAKTLKSQQTVQTMNLGGAIFQKHGENWHPVAYASRSLTKTEQLYNAQIEKECLSIVFATTRFHEYVYANKFLVQSDYKPLQTTLCKELSKMPARIQRMMLKLQSYPDMTLKYKPGHKMKIADALSRAPESTQWGPEIQDIDLQVHRVV